MILTKHEILQEIKDGGLAFTPMIDQFQLQPHAVDLRLGYKFLIPRNSTVIEGKGRTAIKVSIEESLSHSEQYDEVILKPGEYFDLNPNEFVIATTLERVEFNSLDLMGILFPRTSTNRRGINLSATGIIDVGYKGNLIMPMKNEAGDQVLRVYPGERVCQIIFERLASPLTQEETQLHGVMPPKYSDGEPRYRLDKDDERTRIIEGKLEEMKKEYPLPL